MKVKSPASRADARLKNFVLFGEEGTRSVKSGRLVSTKPTARRPKTTVTEPVRNAKKR
jgi:hypothetical protein